MTRFVDSTIFDKKPMFLGIFLFISFLGVLLISISAYHASRELEVIHEVDNMSNIIHNFLGSKNIEQILADKSHQVKTKNLIFSNPQYRFYLFSNNRFQPLTNGTKEDMQFLSSVDLESSRINEHGGYHDANGDIRTWVKFTSIKSSNYLLVLHNFKKSDVNNMLHAYKKRMIVPVFFYFLLMVWASLIFNHLLHKLRHQKDQMKHMALHDALTGLANRNLLADRLNKLIQINHRDKSQFACSLIDIDEFKAINDKYGHVYGDELLRQVAKRLEGILRESDTAARLGGDEFVVLLTGIDEKSWHAAFERMLTLLVEPYILFETKIVINTSIGVSIYPSHGDDAIALLHNADQAMYSIKKQGGGISVCQ